MNIAPIIRTLAALGSCAVLACANKPAAPSSDALATQADQAASEGQANEESPAADSEPALTPGPVDREWTLEPGKSAELNVVLEAGSRMMATFSTGGEPLRWNIHSHPGPEPTLYQKGTSNVGAPSFEAKTKGTYSFLWENTGAAPVQLTVRLDIEGPGGLHSAHPQ